MEELFFTPETRLGMTLRINSEIIAALASVELAEENIEVIKNVETRLVKLTLYLSCLIISAYLLTQ